ncbi:MAG: zeta toxin family protein [Oscillospiraceae bacterium]|nr:zeta toxin family protein [Oscillospiraceae bacterium]
MKYYTIIAGVNGTGKSSLTGSFKARMSDLGFVIDVDKIAAVSRLSLVGAGRVAVKRISECLEKGISFTQETTLSGNKTVNTAKSARERGYKVRLCYVGLNSLDESLKRIRNRVEKGGHDIDSGTVGRRYANRFVMLKKLLPFCDDVELYDNENGFVLVAQYRNGELLTVGDYQPDWLVRLRDFL